MTITAQVVTSMAVPGAAAPAAPTGIEGLFAALLGGGAGADVAPDATQILAGVGTDAAELPAENILQVGDGTVKVQGEQSVVAAFMAQVQIVLSQISENGEVPQGSELANALIKLGVPAEKAEEMAQRIDTMMALLKQQQDVDKDSENSLEAMMLAAMMGGQQGGFAIQITQVTQTSVQVNVSVQNFVKSGGMSAADVVQQMVANTAQVQTDKGQKNPTGAFADQLAAQAGQVADSDTKSADKDAATELVVDVSKSDDGTVAKVVLSGQVEKPQAVKNPDGQAAVAAARTDAVQAAPQVTSVDKVMEKPEGKTMYKWQADAHGNEAVQIVTQAADAKSDNAAIASVQQQAAHSAGLMKDVQADGLSFADRAQMAAQNRVVDQVAVQIKPLADMGGGTVRMTLNPPELGQVQVELTMRDGKVHGAISASDPVVVEQLARELHSLRHGLADAGLKLGEQGISLMLSNNGNQNQQGQQQAREQAQTAQAAPGWDGVAGVEAAEIPQPEPAAHWVAPERVVDVRI